MKYAILRTQKLKSAMSVHRSMKHAFRAQETPNADSKRTPDNTHIGATSVAEGMAAFKARLPEKVRKNGVLCIEYLITSSPEAMRSKERQEQNSYFNDALEWLKKRHGAENVIYAGIHRDETTPHMYAYVVPIDERGKLNCRAFLGGAKALSEMQTDFANNVGQSHDLQRGIEGSKAKHQTISKFYANIEKKGQIPEIKAEELKPRIIEKRFLGLVHTEETAEGVADRLTEKIEKLIQPFVENASIALSERTRSIEMRNTALGFQKKLKAVEARLNAFNRDFGELTPLDEAELRLKAQEKRQKAAIEKAQKRRVDNFPFLEKYGSDAVYSFAVRAIEAIKKHSGLWTNVNWQEIEKKLVETAINKIGVPKSEALRAVLEHSPRHADKSALDVDRIVALAKEREKYSHAQLNLDHDDYLSL
jgi:Plasmid recombination enzyme